MAISKIILNGVTQIDVTGVTTIESDVANNKVFIKADGTSSTGSYVAPTLITKSITANGTYDPADDNADGYSEVTVNVSGGGGLVVETGIYEPEADEQAPTIYFANAHTSEPMYAQIADTESSTATALSYIVCLSANSGAYDDDPRTWGQARRSYINSSNNVTGSNTTFSSIYNVQVFMTNTYYKPAGSNTGYYFRAGRTYKWIAVWAPT